MHIDYRVDDVIPLDREDISRDNSRNGESSYFFSLYYLLIALCI